MSFSNSGRYFALVLGLVGPFTGVSPLLPTASSAWASESTAATSTANPDSTYKVTRPNVYEAPGLLGINTGVISYQNGAGGSEARLATSALFDLNISQFQVNESPLQYGAEGGLIFSHTGSPGANFFGTNSPNALGAAANLYIAPLRVWGGYAINRKGILGIETGADVFFRSTTASMNLGRSGQDSSGGSVDFFPMIGLKAGWTIGPNIGISFKPTWTLTPTTAVFMGLLGADLPLG